jgi:hypothetical protein
MAVSSFPEAVACHGRMAGRHIDPDAGVGRLHRDGLDPVLEAAGDEAGFMGGFR